MLNVDHRTYKPDVYDQEIEIDAISMDDYVLKNISAEGGRVDFVKMDIQGFEMQAVQGMQRLFRKNTNLKLISEFWPYGLKKAGSSVSDYFNFLTSFGFNCYLLEKKSLKLLNKESVAALSELAEEHYFNIFATRSDV